MGRKTVTAEALRKLCKMSNVVVVGVMTDSHLSGSPTTSVANELGVKLYSFDEALFCLKNNTLEFDLGLSILYWRKLREEFLEVPKLGVINFHPAPLPEYKGTAGYNLAILEARNSWAVSAHYIDAEIDTGPIVEVSSFPIDSDRETCESLEKKSMLEMAKLIDKVAKLAINSSLKLDSFPNIGGRYISREQMEKMKQIQSGDDVARKVRAFWFPPYDGAYMELQNCRYTLVNQEILERLAPIGSTSLFTQGA